MLKTYALLVFCVICWGSNFVFGAILVQQFPPLLVSAFRLVFTSLVLVGIALYLGKLRKLPMRAWKILIPLGLIGTLLNQSAFFTGLQTTDSTTASLIMSLTPIMTAFLAAIFLKESIAPRVYVGSAIAVGGVYLVVGNGAGIQLTMGVLYIFIAMLTFAISIILTRKLTDMLDPYATTVFSTLVGTAFIVPVAFSVESIYDASPHLWAWGMLIGTAILMQVICGLIWNGQLKKVGAGKVSIFLNLQPFVAMVLGYVLLGMKVTGIQIVGSVLIIGGVILATGYFERSLD